MAKSAPSDDWFNAASASADGFTYSGGEFFAEASGQKRHRRQSPAELKALVTSGNDKFHPAHWFEAQLLHYGLKPSKTKSVARMRLSDAVNAGELKVPDNIAGLEKKLKGEWMKETAKMVRGESSAKGKAAKTTRTTGTTGTKRKTTEADLGGNSAKRATKKAKTEPATTTAPKKPAKKATVKGKAQSETSPVVKATVKQTARRGTHSQAPSRRPKTEPKPEPSPPRMRQTARRSGAFMARGRIPAPGSQPSYTDNYNDDSEENGSPQSYTSDEVWDHPEYPGNEVDGEEYDFRNVPLAPLGLLNGNYHIISPEVTQQWSRYGSDFELTLTLDGSSLWGKFDLGVVAGILLFEQRPRKSSDDPIPFTWRGRENEGPILYGDSNTGWIRFLGDGRIEGELSYQGIDFRGRRVSGQETRSEVSAAEMRNEWEGYSEDAYEYENRSRWGGYYGRGW